MIVKVIFISLLLQKGFLWGYFLSLFIARISPSRTNFLIARYYQECSLSFVIVRSAVRPTTPVITRSAAGTTKQPPTSSLRGRAKPFRSNLLAWFPYARLSPMFVIARKDEVLPKQSLISTPGSTTRL